MLHKFLRTFLPIILAFATAQAAELKGVKMPDEIKVGEKALKLNGLGLRLATIFKVKVYVAGLYLETPSKDSAAILASPQVKVVETEFLRDVDEEKLKETWIESFEKNCESQCAAFKAQKDSFVSWLGALKTGEHMKYVFYPDRVEFYLKGVLKGKVDGADFSRLILSFWLGAHPANAELKDGMLGL